MKWGCCLAAAVAALFLWVRSAQPSGPIAVYALVDKVAFEPNADHPERIRISGVFILSSVPKGCGSPSLPCSTTYSEPRKGSLYFSLPSRGFPQALLEWQDVKSVAGTRRVIGFGSGWFPNDAKLLHEGERADSPPEWPVNNSGVVRVNADQPYAKALLEYKDR